MKRGKVSVTYVRNGERGQLSSERRHNKNDVITRTGAASAVGARRLNENDVTITIAWLMETWRLATCDHGLHRSSTENVQAGT